MEFCSKINSMPETARVYRLLSLDQRKGLEKMKLPSGRITDKPEEILNYLLEEHFPEGRDEASEFI